MGRGNEWANGHVIPAYADTDGVPPVSPGDRVKITGRMIGDPAPMEIGAQGTVQHIYSSGSGAQIDVRWDNGRSLMLLPHDPFTVIR